MKDFRSHFISEEDIQTASTMLQQHEHGGGDTHSEELLQTSSMEDGGNGNYKAYEELTKKLLHSLDNEDSSDEEGDAEDEEEDEEEDDANDSIEHHPAYPMQGNYFPSKQPSIQRLVANEL